MELTDEQIAIVREPLNCVVVAKPGSGKTFTLAHKIHNILHNLPSYKGVIAISYTNMASDELESRCLSTGVPRRGSFFGTIDKFFLSEIIIPFGRRIFGEPIQELQVLKSVDIPDDNPYELAEAANKLELFRTYYEHGIIVLESVGFLALYILDNCQACRRYIKARYTHIVIDEYQDCGEWQHKLFMRLVELGLIGVAVGDIDQSIFGFAGRSSKYLTSLAENTKLFKAYPLSINHRCHESIINYSTRLLSSTYEAKSECDVCVYGKHIVGSEIELAEWLSKAIPTLALKFNVGNLNQIGILIKNRITGNLIHKYLSIPHKPFATTPLDEDSSLWGSVFRKTLSWIATPQQRKFSLLESYVDISYQNKYFRDAIGILDEMENLTLSEENADSFLVLFERFAKTIFPMGQNRKALANLKEVLTNQIYLSSFIPPKNDEVQLMTLHKAKGLEFEVVFHLNLHRFILPQYQGDFAQDLNLHYVGITRAKKCCVLCWSTQRHNKGGDVVSASESEFLSRNGLENWRVPCPV